MPWLECRVFCLRLAFDIFYIEFLKYRQRSDPMRSTSNSSNLSVFLGLIYHSRSPSSHRQRLLE